MTRENACSVGDDERWRPSSLPHDGCPRPPPQPPSTVAAGERFDPGHRGGGAAQPAPPRPGRRVQRRRSEPEQRGELAEGPAAAPEWGVAGGKWVLAPRLQSSRGGHAGQRPCLWGTHAEMFGAVSRRVRSGGSGHVITAVRMYFLVKSLLTSFFLLFWLFSFFLICISFLKIKEISLCQLYILQISPLQAYR